jgi:hypothetical protein
LRKIACAHSQFDVSFCSKNTRRSHGTKESQEQGGLTLWVLQVEVEDAGEDVRGVSKGGTSRRRPGDCGRLAVASGVGGLAARVP